MSRAPLLKDSVEWQEILKVWQNEKRVCFRCGAIFVERDNMGQWKCTYHPGRICDHVWDCCNQPVQPGTLYYSNGCKGADHAPQDMDTKKDIPQLSKQVVLKEIITNSLIKSPIPESIDTDILARPLAGVLLIKRKED